MRAMRRRTADVRCILAANACIDLDASNERHDPVFEETVSELVKDGFLDKDSKDAGKYALVKCDVKRKEAQATYLDPLANISHHVGLLTRCRSLG